jgi:HAD superfamily hydrolase (TIGR01509 family)
MYEEIIKKYLDKTGFTCFNPKAVLFDMDGVLYDSMPNHAQSWHHSMAKFGLKMAPEEAYEYEGMRGVETIKVIGSRQWNRTLTDEEADEIYKEKCHYFRTCPKAKKMDGVEQLMHKIKDAGLKIVVVTGSGQKSLLSKLEVEFPGLISEDLMVTSFDVSRGKPNPEPYLQGLSKADIQPYEGIVVENAPLGVQAGVAAKIFTVAVNTGPLSDKMLANEGANLIFDKMTDFRDHWESLLKAKR